MTLLLAFACSVYELPNEPMSNGNSGAAGAPVSGSGGATAGSVAEGGRGGSGGEVGGSSGSGGSAGSARAGAGGSDSGGGGSDGNGDAGAPAGAAGDGGAGGEGGDGGVPPPPDNCPNDPSKLQPGKCGCGIPDVATAQMADCATVEKKLVHRYDFEGTGTMVTDRVGSSHGVVRGAQLSKIENRGVVLLGGGASGGYVDLPNAILSGLKNASFEAWLTWGGGEAQQRVFDFGDTTNNVEDTPGVGKTYFFASGKAAVGGAQVGFSLDGVNGEQHVDAASPLPTSLTQVVVVADDDQNRMQLYVNGKKAGESEWQSSLGAIHVVNAWLGRSQWDRDPELSGVFHDFRVYNAALTAAEVATTYVGGPDPRYLTD